MESRWDTKYTNKKDKRKKKKSVGLNKNYKKEATKLLCFKAYEVKRQPI
jgi:hypothetical protein